MHMHTNHIFQLRGDNMKFMKSMALMAMGAGAMMAYQKYSKPAMRKIKKSINKTANKFSDELEDMM